MPTYLNQSSKNDGDLILGASEPTPTSGLADDFQQPPAPKDSKWLLCTKEAAKLTKTLNASVSRAHQEVKAMDIVEAEKGQLVIDVADAKGAEKAVWDYTQANSMAVRWRSFVKELLQMSKVQESIIRDFNHDDFMVKLSTMDRTQLKAVYEIMMKSVDWLINIIRDMEDVDSE